MASAPKKPKLTNSAGVLAVDTTDSVSNLIKHFKEKNKFTYSFYRKVTEQGSEHKINRFYHFLIPGHPLNTFPEDFDGELPSRYFEKFPYKSTMPCIATKLKNPTSDDPVTEMMRVKSDWKVQWLNATNGALLGHYLQRTTKQNDKVYTCPMEMVHISLLMDKDPDPHFSDTYNWYYAGNGNLHVISVNDRDCLLISQLSRLYLTKFSRRKLATKNTPIASYCCGEGNNIFETICNSQNMVAIRLKNKIIILKLTNEKNSIIFQNIKEIEAKIPYTSIEFDLFQKNILYVTKLDGTLYIINLNIMKCRTLELMKEQTMENNWNKVLSIDALHYCHVSRNELKIYDKRTNECTQQYSDIKKFSESLCDEFTVAKKCQDVPFVLLGTNHYMFLMDFRNEPKPLRRWTHQMQSVPTYISQIKHEANKDIFLISSQWPDDTCLISNETNIYHEPSLTTSMTMPYGLPTFEITLETARHKMLCVDIYKSIESRIYTSVTGNCLMPADQNVIALTLNSLGDIFAYTLHPEHLEIEDDSLEKLHEWVKTIAREKRLYDSSTVEDISHVWKELKKLPKDCVLGDKKLVERVKTKFSEGIVFDVINSAKLDNALLDIWLNNEQEDGKVDDSALTIDLHFSDSD